MYGLAEHEVIRQRHAEIRREVAANRLARELRGGRGTKSRLVGKLGWELVRYAGLLGKRLRELDTADRY